MREFLSPYDTRLNKRSNEVSPEELQSDEVQQVIDEMIIIANGERDSEHPERPSMVGLAAPQIGYFKQIILVDMAADPGAPNFEPRLEIFVNPRIVKVSTLKVLGREGCYSTGKICGAVHRADSVTVAALSRYGNDVIVESETPFQARIFQHEKGHLDGTRFPELIHDLANLHLVEKSEFGEYRKEWRRWPVKCPPDFWRNMRAGIEPVADKKL